VKVKFVYRKEITCDPSYVKHENVNLYIGMYNISEGYKTGLYESKIV